MPEVSEEAAECLRIESGRPRLGLDMDGDTIPQEAGLNERAVSFTKGCYVGQETVARLHYKGKPNRHLRGLRLAAPAERGDEILLGDQVVGRSARPASRPASGRSRWRSCGARPRPGDEVLVAGGHRPRWSSCPSRVTERRDRRRAPRSRHGLSGASPLLGGPLTTDAGAEEPRSARPRLRRAQRHARPAELARAPPLPEPRAAARR